MFDFSQKKKEKYWRKGEKQLDDAGIKELIVDRKDFAVQGNKIVKIRLIPWKAGKTVNKEVAKVEKMKNVVIEKPKREDKSELYKGYMVFELSKEDR